MPSDTANAYASLHSACAPSQPRPSTFALWTVLYYTIHVYTCHTFSHTVPRTVLAHSCLTGGSVDAYVAIQLLYSSPLRALAAWQRPLLRWARHRSGVAFLPDCPRWPLGRRFFFLSSVFLAVLLLSCRLAFTRRTSGVCLGWPLCRLPTACALCGSSSCDPGKCENKCIEYRTAHRLRASVLPPLHNHDLSFSFSPDSSDVCVRSWSGPHMGLERSLWSCSLLVVHDSVKLGNILSRKPVTHEWATSLEAWTARSQCTKPILVHRRIDTSSTTIGVHELPDGDSVAKVEFNNSTNPLSHLNCSTQ